MKRVKQPNMEIAILPEYGKKKLLDYADTIRDIAKAYLPIKRDEIQDAKNLEQGVIEKQTLLYRKQIYENRVILADHLEEMAHIMAHFAEDSFLVVTISARKQRQIIQLLKAHGVLVQTLYYIRHRNGHAEISIMMRACKSRHFETEEVAGVLSVLLNRRFVPDKNCVMNIGEENDHFIFVEETKYILLTGIAKAVKENETMSGDNYSFCDIADNHYICALSDGMGSGQKACEDSALVIDILEKLMEAGFESERAITLINGTLLSLGNEQNLSTLDMCDINLQTGLASFWKVGAVSSYIKRRNGVEILEGNSLPLGIFHQLELNSVEVQLKEGDYIILISDGILEAFQDDEAVYLLQEFIEEIEIENPREIANYILQFVIRSCGGKILDDMTVGVAGLWKNDEESREDS